MRCISVREPWASWIVDGLKPVENRSWGTKYRGPLLIQASKAIDKDAVCPVDGIEMPDPSTYSLGALIGAVKLVECWNPHEAARWLDFDVDHREHWYQPGQKAWILRRAFRLKKPIPCRGKLGIFQVNQEPLEPEFQSWLGAHNLRRRK